MPGVGAEKVFEQAIEEHLLDNGYLSGKPSDYDSDLGLDLEHLFGFLKESQPDEWTELSRTHGADVEAMVAKRLVQELGKQGTLRVLRQGITDHGAKLRLAFFRPATSLGPELVKRYGMNRVSVTRQVPMVGGGTVDLVVFVNGIPVATAELKSQVKGQNHRDAIAQYRKDRNPKDPLFLYPTRSLVHFAVDQDEVWMTTRLLGPGTRFLPFNKGSEGGVGNPDNPDGYKTAYWWEEVLRRDSLLDLLQRFVTIEYPPDKKGLANGLVIFPRYHQWDLVRRLETDARVEGSGRNYLVMHSTGSGKSLSIGWTAHRLFSLHDAHNDRVFHSVVVVTDRVVLDQQLQDTIYSIEHKHGVVRRIDQDAKQLAAAIEAGVPIIITTLQKFPFVVQHIGTLPARNYAVIVDEAHSSQTGEAAKTMKAVLAATSLEDAEVADDSGKEYDPEEEVLKAIAAIGPQANLSYFAFTATPKAKTLEVFGTDLGDGKPRPFHTYSMKQAIDEGFIVDVLQHYTTYQRFYKLSKEIENDPEFESKAARKAIARFVELHPHNIAQKVEVIVEHFRQNVAAKINGEAKAMVTTASRLHAVRFYLAIRQYLAEHEGDDIGVLVAFSGTVRDPDTGVEYTEAGLNGFGEKQLPDEFDGTKWRLLIVAEKYQTGYSQPKLHTMYVDKKLRGLHAVQTLGRLNRTHPAKKDTFILDFVNAADEIIEAFAPYYTEAVLESRTNPNLLHDLKTTLDDSGVYWWEEVEQFATVFFKPLKAQQLTDQGELNAAVDIAVGRFQEVDEENQETFRHTLAQFLRLYSFLAYVMTFRDPALEKLHAYGRWLIRKLPSADGTGTVNFDDDLALAAYRLDKSGTVAIDLDEQEATELKPIGDVGGQVPEEQYVRLSELIKAINERFGLNLTNADALFFEQVGQDLLSDDTLAKQAKKNSMENFAIVFAQAFLSAVLGRKDRNDDLLKLILDSEEFKGAVQGQMLPWVYHGLRDRKSIPELIQDGESGTVEFKSSARWNYKANMETPEIPDAVVKTVAAFLNTDGGTLLIGVADDGELLGLAPDLVLVKGKDLDGYENWLMGALLTDRLGKLAVTHVRCVSGGVGDQDVLRLDMTPSPEPIFAKTSKEPDAFFVRLGNGTHELGKQDMLKYIAEHWPKRVDQS